MAKVCSALDEPTVLRNVYVSHVVNSLAPENVCSGEGFDFKNFEGDEDEHLRKLERYMGRFSEDSVRMLQKEIGSASETGRITEIFGVDLHFAVSQKLILEFLLCFVLQLKLNNMLLDF